MDISGLSPRKLLQLHANVESQLRTLKIIRSSNNPTGDLAEYVFCRAFPDWIRAENSQANYDAIGTAPNELKYQIKGRRITQNKSRQLGAIRNLKEKHFDFLAGVLFNEDYSVLRAALVPYDVVEELATFQEHTRSSRFLLVNDIWKDPRVQDVTAQLKAIWPDSVA